MGRSEERPELSWGGRAPNVKPAPSGVRGMSERRLTLGPADGKDAMGASGRSGISNSCDPSSAMAVDGSEPGLGKNTDRLRECSRACRLPAFGEAPESGDEVSGAE
jgi:hypothetical protein